MTKSLQTVETSQRSAFAQRIIDADIASENTGEILRRIRNRSGNE